MKVDPILLPFFLEEELFRLSEPRETQTKESVTEEVVAKVEAVTPAEKIAMVKEPTAANVLPEDKESKKGRVLAVVENQDAASRAGAKDSFLTKVMAAVNIPIEDVQIQIPSEFNQDSIDQYQWVLLFGTPELLSETPTFYEVRGHLMVADPLLEIENEREKKAKLWNGLQTMFNK